MIELYNQPLSTCSRKVRLCMREKELEWTDRLVDIHKFQHHDPEYLKLNPNGMIPTLVHDGRVVIESTIINEYLDDVFPAKSLRPEDPFALSEMRVWNKFIDDVALPAVIVPTWTKFLAKFVQERFTGGTDEKLNAVPLVDRRETYKRLIEGKIGESDFKAAHEKLKLVFDRFEKRLSAAGPWYMGDMFTLADINSFPYIDRGGAINPAFFDKAEYPAVVAWHEAMTKRPSVSSDQAILNDASKPRSTAG